jgi:hypothetical protein
MKYFIILMMLLLSGSSISMAIEEPKYKVLNVDGDFEIREYSAYCIAETFISASDFNDASNAGFKKLFGFISGNNRTNKDIQMTAPVTTSRSEKIDMTAPVTSTKTPEGFLIGFVMPEGFTPETTPIPSDSTIIIRKVNARTVAVIRFSGRWTSTSMDEHEQELKQWLTKSRYLPIGQPVIARYDPPFMPWFLRRNEIQIEIAK